MVKVKLLKCVLLLDIILKSNLFSKIAETELLFFSLVDLI